MGCNILTGYWQALMLSQSCSKDLAAARLISPTEDPNKNKVVASAYMLYDSTSSPPAAEIKKLVDYCHNNGLRLVIGADENAHNVVWRSSVTNIRGKLLLEYIAKKV